MGRIISGMNGTAIDMENELHRMFDVPFTQIDNRIFESEVFEKPVDKLLYMTLIKFSYGKSSVFPSVSKLMKHCCCGSNHTIIDSMNRLIEMRLVVKEQRISENGGFKSNIYHLFDIGVVQKMHNPSAKNAVGVVQKMHSNNKNLEEQEINNKKSVQPNYRDFYLNNMGLAVPMDILEQLDKWATNLSPELVIAATRRAVESNARRYPFVKKLLTDWKNAGISSIAEMEEFENRHKKVVNLRYKKRGELDEAAQQRIREAREAGVPF